MEIHTDLIGNPITLLLERIFWLFLGMFFFSALFFSFIRRIRPQNTAEKTQGSLLKELAEKAILQNQKESSN